MSDHAMVDDTMVEVASPGAEGEVLDAIAALQPFRDAGVLVAAEVHTAAVLARLGAVRDPAVVLAAALAVRAPRLGHVCVDLRTAGATIVPDGWLDASKSAGDADVAPPPLPWPDADAWISAVASSALVAPPTAPLVLEGSRVYLDRYHAYERDVAAELLRRATTHVPAIEPVPAVVDALLAGADASDQRAAVAAAGRSAISVLVGGPGTGKTTAVAALLASLVAADPDVRIALAAPTGKAAARLGAAFRAAALRLEPGVAERLVGSEASTIHRLLGVQRSSATRFHHDRHRPMPHDVVIIDETSMVSLPLMAKLLDAVRPEARLVLVGDPGQLASVEAGSVLGDVAGPAADAAGSTVPLAVGAGVAPLAGAVSVLRHSRRFPPGSPIDRFAAAVRRGDADAAVGVLGKPQPGNADPVAATIEWVAAPADDPAAIARVRELVEPVATEGRADALAGDAARALAQLERMRILCAHRRGSFGVERWNARVEAWLRAVGRAVSGWYPGRPVLVTANDYRLGLYNGDLGVVVTTGAGPRVAFEGSAGTPRLVAPARLESVETVHAMTIHKSQGSEFDHVVVVLPPAQSRLATRELIYTAVTRARSKVTIVGDEAAVRAAIGGRVERASGLRDALWPPDGDGS